MDISLSFDKGTILLKGIVESNIPPVENFIWDDRVLCYRAPAFHYRQVVTFLNKKKNII